MNDKEKRRLNRIRYMKEYSERPENKLRKKECRQKSEYKLKQKEYNQRPENKLRKKEYRQRPENKVKDKEYNQRPENILRRKESYQIPENKLRKKEYRQRPEVKLRKKEYSQRAENKLRANKYRQNSEAKLKLKEYRQIPNINIKMRLRHHLRQVFNNYIKTKKLKKSKAYGVNWDNIIENLKPFPKDITEYHIDHIMPIASFNFINEDGSHNLTEIRKAFSPNNHQWLLASQNLSKGKKIIKQEMLFKL